MRDKVTDEEKYDFKGGTHQRVNGLWFRIEGNAIVDHDQYRHDLEERSRLSTPAPSPASVQSEVVVLAELVKIGGASWDNEKIQRAEAMIEADRDAQRQIGRDEVQEKAENIIVDLRKRYSTVVEAAKVYLKEHSCSDSHGVCQDETNLRKALSDLDQSAPQDAKDN